MYQGRNGYSSSDNASIGSQDEYPEYLLEHLATFAVSPETGVVYPADGMRRLLTLEKTHGIWTQKILMRLERRWVVMVDKENGDVIERFPMVLIREPTAFTSQDPKELYNNIYIFIVTEDATGRSRNPSEMHIFQCVSVSAQEVVEDMKMAIAGKLPAPRPGAAVASGSGMGGGGGGGHSLPPPPLEPPPDPPNGRRRSSSRESGGGGSDVRVRSGEVDHHRSHHHRSLHHRGPDPSARDSGDEMSNNSSNSDRADEKQIAILNHCFDDIERFIARLQYAVAAQQELDRRRRNRNSRKKDLGDGMLEMRARPPREVDFVDIFKKFKLSFNQLAKLRAHIHDPNAPELVHFLFTPLALIVDAARDSYQGQNLPSRVVSPLLTHDALELLRNCLTSKETELWHSLGDAWLMTRADWKAYVPPYEPVFGDGWEPGPVEAERTVASEAAEKALRKHQVEAEHQRRTEGPPVAPAARHESVPLAHTHAPHPETNSDISADSMDRDPDRGWLNHLKATGATIVIVTYPRTGSNDKELTVERGEYLEVLDNSRNWWKVRKYDPATGRMLVGHVPHTIVSPFDDDGDSESDVEPRRPPAVVIPRPSTVALPSTTPVVHKQESPPSSGSNSTPATPPPPPAPKIPAPKIPAPTPPVVSAVARKRQHKKRKKSLPEQIVIPQARFEPKKPEKLVIPPAPASPRGPQGPRPQTPDAPTGDVFHHELTLAVQSWPRKPPLVTIHRTPDSKIRLTPNSTASEVQKWLKEKEFPEKMCKALENADGQGILSLTRKENIRYFGRSHGARLSSQLELAKITAAGNGSELETALMRQQNKLRREEKRESLVTPRSTVLVVNGASKPPLGRTFSKDEEAVLADLNATLEKQGESSSEEESDSETSGSEETETLTEDEEEESFQAVLNNQRLARENKE